MRKIHREITKEEYKKLKELTYDEQHDWLFPEGVPPSWENDFGYYGHELIKRNGHYCVAFSIGATYN